jgi:hypothetical protein
MPIVSDACVAPISEVCAAIMSVLLMMRNYKLQRWYIYVHLRWLECSYGGQTRGCADAAPQACVTLRKRILYWYFFQTFL